MRAPYSLARARPGPERLATDGRSSRIRRWSDLDTQGRLFESLGIDVTPA